MTHSAPASPWAATLTGAEHSLILYFLLLAGLALLFGFVRAYVTRGEVGPRYRKATIARLGVMGIAGLAYVLMIAIYLTGYESTDAGWVPSELAVDLTTVRFVEWSLTVPLLCAELLAVATLLGPVARRARYLAMTLSFLMIFTGFLGVVVFAESGLRVSLIWFGIGCAFWIATNVVLVRALRASLPGLTPEAATLFQQASVLLLAGWTVYPVVVLVQLFTEGGAWTAATLIALTVADVVIKVGFGGLIHRVAKLRTAEDVRAGQDVHPESIWISSVKQSDAGVAGEVFLAEGSAVHETRTRPLGDAAVGMSVAEAAATEASG